MTAVNGNGHQPDASAIVLRELAAARGHSPDTPADRWPDIPTDIPPDGRPPDDAGAVRRVRLTPASAIPMRPVRWLWDGRIPAGAITLLPGREGIGKSLALAWLAARLTRGQLPGLHYGTARPVIYAATEDSWGHTIAPRLH